MRQMTIRLHMMVLMCAWMSCVPLQALAQDAQEELNEEEARAQEAFTLMKEGFAFFSEKDYGKAIAAWKDSFRVYPTGTVQLNMAKAYAELGEFEQARKALIAARGKSNTTLLVPLSKLELIDLEKFELELRQKEEAYKAQEQARALEAKKKACLAHSSRVATSGRVGLGVAGAGVMSLGVAGVFAAGARRQLSALQPPHTQGEETFNQDVQAFETSQRRTAIALGVGSGLVLIGAGLFAYDMTTIEYDDVSCAEVMEQGEARAMTPTLTTPHAPRVTWGLASVKVRF